MAYVYILRSGGENLFKIGRTDGDVEARIRQLATGNPYRLTKFDVIDTEHDSLCETYLHRMLRSKRSLASGAREFFEITPEELKSRSFAKRVSSSRSSSRTRWRPIASLKRKRTACC
jgi:hypothetical protein